MTIVKSFQVAKHVVSRIALYFNYLFRSLEHPTVSTLSQAKLNQSCRKKKNVKILKKVQVREKEVEGCWWASLLLGTHYKQVAYTCRVTITCVYGSSGSHAQSYTLLSIIFPLFLSRRGKGSKRNKHKRKTTTTTTPKWFRAFFKILFQTNEEDKRENYRKLQIILYSGGV